MSNIDKKKIPKHLDRRRKITPKIEREVRHLHKKGVSIRQIAREVPISRRSVQFILFPERREKAMQDFIERRKDGRYKPTKESWRKTMREHRDYKRKIIDELI